MQDLFQYFSDYALVHVALYGKAFIPAAKDTWSMFKVRYRTILCPGTFGRYMMLASLQSRGWKTIINDSLISVTLLFGSFAIGLITMGIGVGIGATNAPKDSREGYLALVGTCSFLAGMMMCFVLSTVISAAVKSVFVCFGECPVSSETKPNA